MATHGQLLNYINGEWQSSSSHQTLNVTNPATAEVLARVPISSGTEVDEAVGHAAGAFEAWRRTPVTERVEYLFKLKNLLEENIQEMARILTQECGKTYAESLGELRRGIENVEVACGTSSLMQGYNNEDIATGIDEHMFRQPLGVVAAITPFNFPGMIPLWFLPYAVACGNCFILKPSERVPMTSNRLFELLKQIGLPRGVVQLINGDRETVEALLDHPSIRAISFVGSTPVAKHVYSRASCELSTGCSVKGVGDGPVWMCPPAPMPGMFGTSILSFPLVYTNFGHGQLTPQVGLSLLTVRFTGTPRVMSGMVWERSRSQSYKRRGGPFVCASHTGSGTHVGGRASPGLCRGGFSGASQPLH